MHKDNFPTVAMLVDRSTLMVDFVSGAERDKDDIALYYQLTFSFGNIFSRWENGPPIRNP
jgi:hypothetical protein